jgi:hypothetical protein
MRYLVITDDRSVANVSKLIPVQPTGTLQTIGDRTHSYRDETGFYLFVDNNPLHYCSYSADNVIIDPALGINMKEQQVIVKMIFLRSRRDKAKV